LELDQKNRRTVTASTYAWNCLQSKLCPPSSV